MEKINIFVVSHKKIDSSKYPERKIIYVGKKHNCRPNNKYIFVDNIKNNISNLNPYYCELTALYWVWKNYPKCEYIGFEHYSRNFYKHCKPASLKYLYSKATRFDIIHIARSHHIKSCKWFWIKHEGKNLYPILKSSVKKIQPKYFDDFMKIMNGHRMSYCNMFICKWEIFDKFMNYIFSILNDAFKKVKKLPPEIQSRSIGFMSERLLDAFILQNKYNDKSLFIKIKRH